MLTRSSLVAYLLLCLSGSTEATRSIYELDDNVRQQVFEQGHHMEATFCQDCFSCFPTLIAYGGERYATDFHECGEFDLAIFDKMFEQPKMPINSSPALPAVDKSQKLESPSLLRQMLLSASAALDDTKENRHISMEIVSKQTVSLSPAQERSQLLRPTFSGNDLYLLAEVLENVTNALLPRNNKQKGRDALKRSIGSMMTTASIIDFDTYKPISPPH